MIKKQVGGNMGRTQIKGVKKSRSVGHRPKRNKKSVTERRRLRRLQDKLLDGYFHRQQSIAR